MGIISRFSDIMKSNINALLDKCEDPAKMVDQMLIDLRRDLADVKSDTAGVMADAKRAKREVDECQANIEKCVKAAQNALKAGVEDDARKILAKKQAYEQSLVSLQQTYELNQANADKMQQMHDKLVGDIESLEARKDAIKAKVASAKAQEKINKMMSGGKNAQASVSAFERMEDKANKMLDKAQAEAELNSGDASASNLMDKYANGGDSDVDDELARMKAELGL